MISGGGGLLGDYVHGSVWGGIYHLWREKKVVDNE